MRLYDVHVFSPYYSGGSRLRVGDERRHDLRRQFFDALGWRTSRLPQIDGQVIDAGGSEGAEIRDESLSADTRAEADRLGWSVGIFQ
jgi:hypothetical protein